MPESKTPIGCEAASAIVWADILFAAIDRDRWLIVARQIGWDIISQRLADRMRMQWQIGSGRGKCLPGARPKIDGGIIILDSLCDGRADLLAKLRRRDALTFRRVAEKAALDQNAGDFDVPQNVKTRVFHTAIKHRQTG